MVIEGGKVGNLSPAATPPGKTSLQDYIPAPGRAAAAAAAHPVPRAGRHRAAPRADRTGRAPLRDPGLANEIKAFLITRGAPAEVYQGSTARRARLVFETRAEGPVFKALVASATALIQIRERFPDQIEAFEVVCEMPESDGEGGRFTLTPEQAADLISGRVDLTRYYVDNVEF